MRERGFEPVALQHAKQETSTLLPLRGTRTSAGYDFYTPVDLKIKPQDKLMFWTDVKAYMKEGEVLLLDVRSSIGIKQDLMLANTIPVIDSDYHNNITNDGNIGICLRNLKPALELENKIYARLPIYTSNQKELEDGGIEYTLLSDYDLIDDSMPVTMDFPIPVIKDLVEENTVFIKAGDRVAQGIFVSYLPSDNCNSEVERTGGIGSSNKKGDK